MTLFNILSAFLSVLLIGFALLSLLSKKLIHSVLFLSGLSMLAAVAFVLLKAPDVAMTEAVIGSGLVTALFVFTLLATNKLVIK
jgi:uncharacterized MnhB-related membrane protein